MQIYVQPAIYADGQISAEDEPEFIVEDDGTQTTVRYIHMQKRCPMCNYLQTVYFLEHLTFDNCDTSETVTPYFSMDTQCRNCNRWFRSKARLLRLKE